MKILRVEQFSVADESLKKIEMPTTAEIELAALNLDGKPLLQYWFEFGKKLQNEDGSKIRNRSGSDVYNASDVDGFIVVREFDGDGVMTTRFRSYESLSWGASEYTIFAVLKVGNLGAGYTFAVGTGDTGAGIVNPPNLNVANTGAVRVFKNGATGLIASAVVGGIFDRLNLITITQSKSNGCAIRANKINKTTSSVSDAKLAGNAKSLKLLGSQPLASANFNGSIAALILCPKDLTNSVELDLIEDYLFEKYCK